MTTYRSNWLDIPGAAPASDIDSGVASHYGEPIREQRWLMSGALVDRSNLRIFRITGTDRLTWLDSLSSQSLKTLQSGESAQSLILDPNGRIEHELNLAALDDELWLFSEPDAADALISWLEKMKFRSDVQIQEETSEFAALGTFGDPVAALGAAGFADILVIAAWQDPWSATVTGGMSYSVEDAEHPASGWQWIEFIISRADFDRIGRVTSERVQLKGADEKRHLAGINAFDALRIEHWRPRLAREADDRSLPHELDLLRSAVHLSKGCYRGQETVAKVHNLGHPPRRLTFLHLEGSLSSLPKSGAEIFNGEGEKVVGRVTTAAWHHELGLVALAVLRRNVPVSEELLVRVEDGAVQALQDVIVRPDSGANAQASLKRRRLLS